MPYNGRVGTCIQETCCRVNMLGHDASSQPSIPRPQHATHCRGHAPSYVYGQWCVEWPSTPSHSEDVQGNITISWTILGVPSSSKFRPHICHSKVSMVPISISTSGLFLYFIKRRDNNAYIIAMMYLHCSIYSTHKMQNVISFLLFKVFFYSCGAVLELQS